MCDPIFYAAMTNVLNEEQRKSVQDIFTLADQRRAAAESKEIQKRGGKSILTRVIEIVLSLRIPANFYVCLFCRL